MDDPVIMTFLAPESPTSVQHCASNALLVLNGSSERALERNDAQKHSFQGTKIHRPINTDTLDKAQTGAFCIISDAWLT